MHDNDAKIKAVFNKYQDIVLKSIDEEKSDITILFSYKNI